MTAAGWWPAAASCLFLLALTAALYAVCRFDLRERRIPNALCLAVASLALLQMALRDVAGFSILSSLPACGLRLAWAAGVLIAGYAFEAVWRLTHGGSHGMGLGDVKLAAALTLWVGPATLGCVAAACLVASAVNIVRRRSSFAFGPYLALAFGTCLLVMLLAPCLCATGKMWW